MDDNKARSLMMDVAHVIAEDMHATETLDRSNPEAVRAWMDRLMAATEAAMNGKVVVIRESKEESP